MCGRFGLTKPPWNVAKRLGSSATGTTFQARYNIAPTQPVLAVLNNADRNIAELRWGLIPSWSDGPGKIQFTTFNARIESLATSPAYRSAERKRCAILADGYYEWRKNDDGTKTPMWIFRRDREPFAFAGVWDVWHSRTSEDVITSCSIITQPPNEFTAKIHNRMPLVLSDSAAATWLKPGLIDLGPVRVQLAPGVSGHWTAHPVDRRVGNVRNEDSELIVAVAVTDGRLPI